MSYDKERIYFSVLGDPTNFFAARWWRGPAQDTPPPVEFSQEYPPTPEDALSQTDPQDPPEPA